ncbi:MAG: hypothetical protein AABY83_14915 [Pseudomonadota bacterium]
MKIKKYSIAVLFFLVATKGFATADYRYVEAKDGGLTTEQFLDATGAPNFSMRPLRLVCLSSLLGGYCMEEVFNGKGIPIITREPSLMTFVELQNITRFKHFAYAKLIVDRHADKKRVGIVINDSGRDLGEYKHHRGSEFFDTGDGDLARAFTGAGEYLQVSDDGIYVDGNLRLASPDKLQKGMIANDLQGGSVAAAVDESQNLWITNLSQWANLGNAFTLGSRIEEELALYPGPDGKVYVAMVRHRDTFQKGLVLMEVSGGSGAIRKGWLAVSENTRLTEPHIHLENGSVYVSVYNSTDHKRIHFEVGEDAFADLDSKSPLPLQDDHGRDIEVRADLSAAHSDWSAHTMVATNDTNLSADFRLASNDFEGIGVKARYRGFLLGGSISQTGFGTEPTQAISATLDFDASFLGMTRMRLGAQSIRVHGLVKRGDMFDSQRFSGGVDAVDVRGGFGNRVFADLSYTRTRMPGVVGISNAATHTSFVQYDTGLSTNVIALSGGYDTLSHPRLVENRLNQFYFMGSVGLGLGGSSLSPTAKQAAEQALNGSLRSSGYFQFAANADIGYIFQRRRKEWWGGGFTLLGGYRWQQIKADQQPVPGSGGSLTSKFSRIDVWQGPYVEFGATF